MKRVLAIADRGAIPLFKLVAALHVIFLAAFLLTVAGLMSKARADAPVCTGSDMLAQLQQSDPGRFAKIVAEGAAMPNGAGLLWRIEKPGSQPSFLYGTMHVTDPRVTALPPLAQKAFEAAGTLVIETTEVLDQAKMLASLMQKPELMMFTDSTTLTSLLTPADAQAVDKALEARGIPPYSVSKMKPWIISAMVALPACELARKAAGAPVLDVKLAQDAKAEGKKLEGLETAADQLEAMASLPLEFHLKGLVDTLKLGDRIDDVIETMVVLYTRGDTGLFWPLFRAVLPSGAGDDAGYAEFEEKMVTSRNRVMADHAGPMIDAGNVFIAVGAMHLPGPEGLVALLRKAGYTVSAVN